MDKLARRQPETKLTPRTQLPSWANNPWTLFKIGVIQIAIFAILGGAALVFLPFELLLAWAEVILVVGGVFVTWPGFLLIHLMLVARRADKQMLESGSKDSTAPD